MNKTTITRERLEEIILDNSASLEEFMAITRMALAAMDSEPVAWRVSFTQIGHESNNFTKTYWDEEEKDRWVKLHKMNGYKVLVEPLYRHAQPAPVVPDFKKLALELVGNLVDCGGLDEGVKERYLEWAEKTCRAAMLVATPQEVKP